MANSSVANSLASAAQVYRVNVALSASLAANSITAGSFLQNQTDTSGVSQLQVSPNQIWKFVDAYVSAALGTDLIVDLWINNTPQNINYDANTTNLALGTTRVNPFAYMTGGGLLVGANSIIQLKALNIVAAPSTATTETLFMVINQYMLK